jgi:hypothetical protein
MISGVRHRQIVECALHADLMLGSAASWFDVKRNIDRLPRAVNPETVATLTPKMEGQLKNWAAERLKQRM